MTKTEFAQHAQKANLSPNLYGAIIAGRMPGLDGEVSDGIVSGIVWIEEWQSEQRYSCMRGNYTETFLGKSPYVVLKKNRKTYRVPAFRIDLYVKQRFQNWLIQKVKNKDPI